MTDPNDWWIEGSYFEACNCEAVCPCRQQGNRPGGRSSYGICEFALSWYIERGAFDGVDLSGFEVVLVGDYDDDEPGSPWRVALYLDDHADRHQQDALADIFLGRAGGTTLANFANAIGEVYAVRSASIHLVHDPDDHTIDVEDHVYVRAKEPVVVEEPVACGIPGYDHPGTEHRCEVMAVDESSLQWEVMGRCGFSTDFSYGAQSPS